METFTKLFGGLLAFVYHCFDRIVIQGYLPRQGFEDGPSEPNKINASTPYDLSGKNLTPYGGLLPVITMLEKLGFQVQSTFSRFVNALHRQPPQARKPVEPVQRDFGLGPHAKFPLC